MTNTSRNGTVLGAHACDNCHRLACFCGCWFFVCVLGGLGVLVGSAALVCQAHSSHSPYEFDSVTCASRHT